MSSTETPTTPWRRWGLAAYACGLVFALGIGYYLFRMPFQVSDNVGLMLELRSSTLGALLETNFFGKAYLRPFLWATLKVLFDLSGGHYYPVFKGFHLVQVSLLMVLFVRVLHVRSAATFAAVPLGCAVLVGMHTFRPLVAEAFPVNTFLTIVVCCMVTLNLSLARPRPLVDLAAIMLQVFAALTLETGLLVWVCFVAAALAGARGVSRVGLVALTGVVVAYFVFRFGIADVGVPSLMERPTGFGFTRLEPQELVARFGDNPWPLYIYNVVCSVLTVLVGEPRRGLWDVTRYVFVESEYRWPAIATVVVVSLTSLLVLTYTLMRLHAWLRRDIRPADYGLIVFWPVLIANAVISYPYTKDEIMSPAGVFYAVAVYVVLTHAIAQSRWLARRVAFSVAVGLVGFALSAAWCWRAAETGYYLHVAALRYRGDWAQIEQWKQQNHESSLPGADSFIAELERAAIATNVPNPWLTGRRWSLIFDER